MKLGLYQEVALTHDVPEHGLKIGDICMLVDFVPHPTGEEEGCVLEVFNAIGESLITLAVPISVVEPLRSDEVLSVRSLAQAS
jgi:hypothetical protein